MVSEQKGAVKHTERDWFRGLPWETVLSINQSLCEAQQTPHQVLEQTCRAARQAWEQGCASRLTLPEAVDVCRRCYDIAPFVFNNGNTFAAVARKLMEDWLQVLPPVEAQIARTTVGHYVVGQITRKEMVEVLSHFESRWKLKGAENPVAPPLTAALRPQAEARIT